MTPKQRAHEHLERDETYDAYVWLLIAADDGDDEAADQAEMLHEVDQVCDEDVRLAELQVALWYHHGHIVARDDARAAQHLPMAAFPWLALPTIEEMHADPSLIEQRDRIWDEAVAKFGIPATGDRAAVAAVLAKIFELAGWPATLDIAQSLGPAMPDRPHHLHHRHVIDSLPR